MTGQKLHFGKLCVAHEKTHVATHYTLKYSGSNEMIGNVTCIEILLTHKPKQTMFICSNANKYGK